MSEKAKLYTEAQLKKAIELAREKYPNSITLTEKGIMMQFTPIEMPTDEEIEEVAKSVSPTSFDNKEEFIAGAKWVIEQIKKQ